MASALKKRSTAKSQRINFRASADEERLIRLGAAKEGRRSPDSLRAVLLRYWLIRSILDLLPAQFARFKEALDRPAKIIPALQRHFSVLGLLRTHVRGLSIAARLVAYR